MKNTSENRTFDAPTCEKDKLDQQLDRYLHYFLQQREAGLLIIEHPTCEERLVCSLEARGLSEAFSWYEALRNVELAVPTFVVLEAPIERELYDLITQYACRDGVIQIMGGGIIELQTVQFDPIKSHLLLVATESSLAAIERKNALRDKVGMIHRLQ